MKKVLLMIFLSLVAVTKGATLPEGFVYLKDVDPTIQQSMRYATAENFVGKPITGYKKQTAILTKEAANALRNVQSELKNYGYELVVYEAYRPQQAVDSFVEWSKNSADQLMKARYYPSIDKRDVFKLGYVAERSGHTRGSTVDLTLIEKGKRVADIGDITFSVRMLSDGREVPFLDDGTVDMFTSFDLLDEASHHDTSLIPDEYLSRRNFLRSIMEKYGFKAYKKEWWHYNFVNDPFPTTYFDFVVE